MHILLVANYLFPYGGGIQRVVHQLGCEYIARGHTVTAVGYQPSRLHGTASPSYEALPLRAVNPLERFGVPFPIFEPLALVKDLSELLRRVDAVHLHGALYLDSLVASLLARSSQQLVVTEHVGLTGMEGGLTRLTERAAFATLGRVCLRRANEVTVINSRVEREMRRLLRPDQRVTIISNGVDAENFRPTNQAERARLRQRLGFIRPTVLTVARHVPKKRLHLLIDAARGADWHLVVAGQDTDRIGSLPANVRILGELDRERLIDLYRAADLFALVSYGEGFPLVVQEALASGLPVIVADDETFRSELSSNVADFVDPDVAAIRQVVTGRLLDTCVLEARSKAATEFARARYAWNRCADEYLALLSKQECDPKLPAVALSTLPQTAPLPCRESIEKTGS
jgi:glycosyltransferase involved in cell wall biosynthesis